MAVTRAVGHPDYTASGAGFIPEIWAGKAVEKFYAYTCFGEIANTNYEGEITAYGDKVHIRTVPDIDIFDYEVGGGIRYQKPYRPRVELTIDRAKGFAFEINDVDKAQSDRKMMDEWSEDAGSRMKIVIDRSVLGEIYVDAAAVNSGATAGKLSANIDLGVTGTPVTLSETNVIGKILDVGQAMDEQDIPEQGRWIVLPSWAIRLLKGSELKDASITGDGTSVLRNGRVGMLDRFMIYQCNQVAHVDDGGSRVANIVAGHKAGVTFASQMTNMETLKNPDDYGSLIRGLNVYGFKVIEPNFLFHLYATRA